MATASPLKAGDQWLFTVSGVEDRMTALSFAIWSGVTDVTSQKWIADVVKNVQPRDDLAEIATVFAAFKKAIRYTFHPRGTDVFRTMLATLRIGTGDCDQATICLCTALHLLGFYVGARIISSDGKEWEHIFMLVYPRRNVPPPETKLWMPLDLTIGPDMTPASARPNYQVPLASMAAYRDFVFDLAL